ncbi:MAG: hypothetical protein SFV19_12465 [Rhodospirillaceae bacterium]|nr:hypothetical protein [Rhodospirillaceae bacterium]
MKTSVSTLIAALALLSAGATAQQTNPQVVHFASVFPSSTGASSFMRLYNASTSAGTFTVTLRQTGSSDVLATWTGSVAPRASTHVRMAEVDVQQQLPSAANGTPYTAVVTSNVPGFAQQVVYKNAESAWANVSACGSATATDTRVIPNVHDRALATASSIVFHNTGSAAAAVRLTILDAANGQVLGTWTSPSFPASTFTEEFSAGRIIAEAGIPASERRGYVTFIIDDAFTGHARHLVTRVGSATQTDMTAKCALAVAAAEA